MKSIRALPFLALPFFFAACDTPGPLDPGLASDAPLAEARSSKGTCRPSGPLSAVTTGTITIADCAFQNGPTTQYEDLWIVNQSRLGQPDRSGATMLTFTGDAPFDAIFGFGGMGPGTPSPVYGFTRFDGGTVGTFRNAFSVVGSSPVYKLWFGGQGPSQLGDYTLTTTVGPTLDTCANGHWVFVEGHVAFDGYTEEGLACNGTVQFGPYLGAPLNYQFWYAKILPGESVEMTLTGATTEDLSIAAIDFGRNVAEIDFPDGPGDTDRHLVFTNDAEVERYIYLEVSTGDGVSGSYRLEIDAG